eukprot:TRINITY_DN122463_c0_g1_i1.p1 TRINITY_DN122463_c0_g1~~TRINITY_DN122463_c0_g1_i1.p1  ORF type:complete len:278 (-),score=53.74 TRINITY_DN122463_c0_g1_i1:151-984(-)
MSSLQQAFVTTALLVVVTTLTGCSFGTSDSRQACDGGACDCENVYYGMEAGIYLGGVPVEHASLHLTTPRVEPDTENSTGCCEAIYALHPMRLPYPKAADPSDDVEKSFCSKCGKAPNTEVAAAAKTCQFAPSYFAFRSSLQSSPSSLKLAATDEGMDGSDDFADCQYEIESSTVPLVNKMSVAGVKASFNVKWTDRKSSSDKACCAALGPVLRSLFTSQSGEPSQAELKSFCDACKSAYNPAVGLAAFRWCTNTSALAESEMASVSTATGVTPVLA